MTGNDEPEISKNKIPYGSSEYGKAWREKHKVRLAEDRKIK